MTGEKRDGIPTVKKVSLGSKSVRMVDGKMVGADGLPVPSTYDEHDTSSCDGTPVKSSYASVVHEGASTQKVNFRLLETQSSTDNADVQIPMSSVLKANARFENTLYGYFLGKRVAFPVVENYVMNAWKKYGITKAMMNAQGFFFFKFNSATGMDGVLENGPWFIRKVPIILKKWSSTASLLKEDLVSVPIWVKLHGVPIAAFTEDGLSAIATKLGTPLMLDSYTSSMCLNSWGRLNFARALIDIRADRILKDSLVVSIPFVEGTGHSLHTVRVEYEWKPPRCNTCMVFGHAEVDCPKRVPEKPAEKSAETSKGAEVKNKKDSDGFQAPRKPFRGLVIGNPKKVVVAPTKQQVFVPKKKAKEASTTATSNSFEALNKVESNEDGSASTNEKVVNQKVNQGKKVASTDDGTDNTSSLYSRWKNTYGTDVPASYLAGEDIEDEEDDVLDPIDDQMAEYMSLHDRKGGGKK